MEREAVEIINAATSSNMKVAEGKESVDVCIAIQGMMEDSRIEGAITFAKELGVSREEVKQSLMAKYEKKPRRGGGAHGNILEMRSDRMK